MSSTASTASTASDLASLSAELTAPDFDVERHASGLIQSGADIPKYLDGLARAEAELDRRIQEQVSAHYEDLISQATGVERLEAHLEMLRSHLATLSSSAERLRGRVSEPHRALSAQTTTLARLQETCDLLRRVIRTLQLGKRLQAQLQVGRTSLTPSDTPTVYILLFFPGRSPGDDEGCPEPE